MKDESQGVGFDRGLVLSAFMTRGSLGMEPLRVS